MQAHTVERVESWSSRPFSGGVRELHELADGDFSGAVVADDTWLFMLNGRVVGVFEGDVEDFRDADGTVYRAPDPSVALLFTMQERGGETQAKYYTNDTPISEADQTLSDANFTGYVELSENVLSGDYYVVYHGGRSMSAAFVGASEELVTGDEAFERADDEVGVYEVRKTPVNVTSLPEVRDDADETAAGGGEAGAAAGGSAAAAGSTAAGAASDGEPAEDAGSSSSEVAAGGDEPTIEDAESGAAAGTDSTTGARDASTADTGDDSTTDDPVTDVEASASDADDSATNATDPAQGGDDSTTSARPSAGAGAEHADDASGGANPDDGVFDEEKEWQNARSIPTLDPEQSASSDGGTEERGTAERTRTQDGNSGESNRSESARRQTSEGPRSTVDKLKEAVRQRDAKLEDAAARIEVLQSERDELQEAVEEARSERDELEARVADLEAELDAVESDQPDGDLALDPSDALSGTNLFVRYGSKGRPTLDGLDASTDADAVNKNLRVDHHTQFDADRATVNGEPFEAFLEASGAYRFVSWAVRELPYEIRDAGHENGLSELYGAIPAIDRAELDGTVAVDTEDGSVSETFDVVLRDRMGNALVVADLNPEREPVTGGEMEGLVDASTAIREGSDDLGAAMCVTASFFEPPALEVADEETGGGGFLGRSDRESFVTVGRKAGYHLCLVEDRNDSFHLTVPEL